MLLFLQTLKETVRNLRMKLGYIHDYERRLWYSGQLTHLSDTRRFASYW